MPQVQTVRGPVDTADLGQTLVHEHVFVCIDPNVLAVLVTDPRRYTEATGSS